MRIAPLVLGVLLAGCSSAPPSDATPCGMSGSPYTSNALVLLDYGENASGHAIVRFQVQTAGACPGSASDVDVSAIPVTIRSAPVGGSSLTGEVVDGTTARLPSGYLLRVTSVGPSSYRIELSSPNGATKESTSCVLSNGGFSCRAT